jgi:hypothetical protein
VNERLVVETSEAVPVCSVRLTSLLVTSKTRSSFVPVTVTVTVWVSISVPSETWTVYSMVTDSPTAR